jgi:hypothetical protein
VVSDFSSWPASLSLADSGAPLTAGEGVDMVEEAVYHWATYVTRWIF